MKTTNPAKWACPSCWPAIPLILLIFLVQAPRLFAQAPPGPSLPTPLDSWSFADNINWTDDDGDPPISFTNILWAQLGSGSSLLVDTNVPAWLNYPIYATNGATNIILNGPGSLCFWYAGEWATTNGGPGNWAQLVDAGEWTSDSSIGYFGLSIDPWGSNVWFFSQDGIGDSYSLSAPISETTNYFHFIALTYSGTNVSLYLDGVLATNDPGGLSIWPDTNVLAGGFYFGSDTNGNYQADGLFSEVTTFDFPLDSNTVQNVYNSEYYDFFLAPWNAASMALSSASSSPSGGSSTNYLIPDVISGPGYLQWDGVASNCTTNANAYYVSITNVSASITGSGTNVTFSINGGQAGYMYDVFATTALEVPLTNAIWAWVGQGAACNTYTYTNIPSPRAFLILGTPQDSTGDGLTDAYKLLVAHLNPATYSTDGTGMADGWEILYFGHVGVSSTGDPDGDGLTTFQEWQMHSENYNPANWNTFSNSLVGDGYQNYSGDGLANLMQASFGGNMLTNNSAWKVNVSGDGLSDEYKTMIGLNPSVATPVLGLPAYSMNPIQ